MTIHLTHGRHTSDGPRRIAGRCAARLDTPDTPVRLLMLSGMVPTLPSPGFTARNQPPGTQRVTILLDDSIASDIFLDIPVDGHRLRVGSHAGGAYIETATESEAFATVEAATRHGYDHIAAGKQQYLCNAENAGMTL